MKVSRLGSSVKTIILILLSIVILKNNQQIRSSSAFAWINDKINIIKTSTFYLDFDLQNESEIATLDKKLSENKTLITSISQDINEMIGLQNSLLSPDYQNLKFDIMKFFMNKTEFVNSEMILIVPKEMRSMGADFQNAIVVSNGGVFARIVSFDGYSLHAIPITNTTSSIPVYTQKSEIYGIASGDGIAVWFKYPTSKEAGEASKDFIDGEEVFTSTENNLVVSNIPFGMIKTQTDGRTKIVPYAKKNASTKYAIVLRMHND